MFSDLVYFSFIRDSVVKGLQTTDLFIFGQGSVFLFESSFR